MNKTKIIKEIVNSLNAITLSLEALIEGLDKPEDKEETKEQQISKVTIEATQSKTEPITLEKVRAVLAAKSQSGKQPEVKALITSHGGNKLTDLDPSCYEELLKEAEVL